MRVVTVERPALFRTDDDRRLELLRDHASEALGGKVVWAPNSQPVRETLARFASHWPTTPFDWPPVAPYIDVAQRSASGDRTSIGMFRVATTSTWPENTLEWTTRLIDDPRLAYNLRGASPPSELEFEWATLSVRNSTSESLQEYLTQIDILANADHLARDPCPVELLIALRSGVIPYLPSSYRRIFGDAALYGAPENLISTVQRVRANHGDADRAKTAAKDLVDSTFSPVSFVQRVRDLVGSPTKATFTGTRGARPNTRVILFSTNGVGMGHLTRQLAVARRLPPEIEPIFLSHSQAVNVARRYGFVAEHTPYHAAYGEAQAHWGAALTGLLDATFDFYRPSALLFDGNVPFKALMHALGRRPEIARLWMRRAMWGKGRDVEGLKREALFDVVMEPGELAEAFDQGPTVDRRANVRQLAPVRLLDADEQPPREQACAELDLDPSATNILIAPGSGNNFAFDPLMREALAALRQARKCQICVAEWMISNETPEWPADVRVLRGYPFARWLNAFEFAIAAAGYNSFVEHVAAALPTIWTPNEHEQMDSQRGRAEFAARRGLGLAVRTGQAPLMRDAVEELLDQDRHDAMRTRLRENTPMNGASSAAAIGWRT